MVREINLFIDYDGSFGYVGPDTIYEDNQFLTQHIHHYQHDPTVSKIIQTCFSRRQGPRIDARNAKLNNNGSAFHSLQIYQDILEKLQYKIELSTLLLEDLSLELPPGTTWARLKEDDWSHTHPESKMPHDTYCDHETKIILFFIQAWHRYHQLEPGTSLEIHILDDHDRIMGEVYRFFSQNLELLPPLKVLFFRYIHVPKHYSLEPLTKYTIENTSLSNQGLRINLKLGMECLFQEIEFAKASVPTYEPRGLSIASLSQPNTPRLLPQAPLSAPPAAPTRHWPRLLNRFSCMFRQTTREAAVPLLKPPSRPL